MSSVAAMSLAALVGALVVGCASGAAPTLTATPTASEATLEVGYQVGNRAPDFAVTATDGRTVTLADMLGQGKPFILYLFATW